MLESARTKAGWTNVAFGDVVRQVKDKVDPEESGLERYVAGEHMVTDELRIRRWGEIGDDYLGPAFHMRFKPGHVLYGSRRTYLRKVALAEFEGITANTTYVLESKDPRVLLPELLPFIMQAEPFHEHSKRESKGSVNPYVNFSDLAWYEFPLPPLVEQRRFLEVLRAAEVEVEACRSLLFRGKQLSESYGHSVLQGHAKELVNVGDVAKFTSGKQVRVSSLPQEPSVDASIPVYGGNGVAGYIDKPLEGCLEPTVVIGRVGQFCGVTLLTSGPAWITDNALYPKHIEPEIDVRFLAMCLTAARLNRNKLGEYLPLVTQKVVHSALMPKLSESSQRQHVEQYSAIARQIEAAAARLEEAATLTRTLSAHLFNRSSNT